MNNFNYSTWYISTVKYKRYKLLQIQTWYNTINEKQDSNRSFLFTSVSSYYTRTADTTQDDHKTLSDACHDFWPPSCNVQNDSPTSSYGLSKASSADPQFQRQDRDKFIRRRGVRGRKI